MTCGRLTNSIGSKADPVRPAPYACGSDEFILFSNDWNSLENNDNHNCLKKNSNDSCHFQVYNNNNKKTKYFSFWASTDIYRCNNKIFIYKRIFCPFKKNRRSKKKRTFFFQLENFLFKFICKMSLNTDCLETNFIVNLKKTRKRHERTSEFPFFLIT